MLERSLVSLAGPLGREDRRGDQPVSDSAALVAARPSALQLVLWSVRLTTNPLMASTNIAYEAPERRRLLFRRMVRDSVFGMLPPVATIILVALVVLLFGR